MEDGTYSFAADVYALGMVCTLVIARRARHQLMSLFPIDNSGSFNLYLRMSMSAFYL